MRFAAAGRAGLVWRADCVSARVLMRIQIERIPCGGRLLRLLRNGFAQFVGLYALVEQIYCSACLSGQFCMGFAQPVHRVVVD